jgi:hypothetical protein
VLSNTDTYRYKFNVIDNSPPRDPSDLKSFPCIKHMMLPIFENSFRDFFETSNLVDLFCSTNAFAKSIPPYLEDLLCSTVIRQMCSDTLNLPDLCRAVFDTTRYLLSIKAEKLPSLFESFLRGSCLSNCLSLSSSATKRASVFDVAKSKSLDSGFNFEGENKVTFPNGPVILFGDTVVGEETAESFWSFIFRGGNSAWSCGLVPETESHNKDCLWKRANSIGQHHSGSGCALKQQSMPESATVTVYVNFTSKTAMFFGEGALTCTVEVPESEVSAFALAFIAAWYTQPSIYDLEDIFLVLFTRTCFFQFPLRLGICGHSGSRFELVDTDASKFAPEFVSLFSSNASVRTASQPDIKQPKSVLRFPPLKKGDLVRRGPDWKWGDQDSSGEGSVTEGAADRSDGWVEVCWKSGSTNA